MSIKTLWERLVRKLNGVLNNGDSSTSGQSNIQPKDLMSVVAVKAQEQGKDFGDYVSLPNRYVVKLSQSEWDSFYKDDLPEVRECIRKTVESLASNGERFRIGGNKTVTIEVEPDQNLGRSHFDILATFSSDTEAKTNVRSPHDVDCIEELNAAFYEAETTRFRNAPTSVQAISRGTAACTARNDSDVSPGHSFDELDPYQECETSVTPALPFDKRGNGNESF